jgi:hypothetical protein
VTELAHLSEAWRARAGELREFGAAEGPARAFEICASELDAAIRASEEELLPLRRAAELSGYSEAHLARLVRDGRIRDTRPAGSRGRIFIRAGDIPKKPTTTHLGGADVHELASRLFGGKEARNGHP